MNVFRLVLCLAGLAAYLVVKQWLHSSPLPVSPADTSPSPTPESNVRHTVSCPVPVIPTDIPKAQHSVVAVRK